MNFKTTLAKLIVDAQVVREASYHRPAGDSFGHYHMSMRDAVRAVIERDGLDSDLFEPAALMLFWPNDAVRWANDILTRTETQAEELVDA